jgi:small subunit ribosomal protein S8
MFITDPIADLLARIRNALARRHDDVKVPFSTVKEAIVKLLVKEGYLIDYDIVDNSGHKELRLGLKYDGGQLPVISGMQRVSKPGQRIYMPAKRLQHVLSGFGVAVVSTSKGIMTDEDARTQKVGGEVLFKIW